MSPRGSTPASTAVPTEHRRRGVRRDPRQPHQRGARHPPGTVVPLGAAHTATVGPAATATATATGTGTATAAAGSADTAGRSRVNAAGPRREAGSATAAPGSVGPNSAEKPTRAPVPVRCPMRCGAARRCPRSRGPTAFGGVLGSRARRGDGQYRHRGRPGGEFPGPAPARTDPGVDPGQDRCPGRRPTPSGMTSSEVCAPGPPAPRTDTSAGGVTVPPIVPGRRRRRPTGSRFPDECGARVPALRAERDGPGRGEKSRISPSG